MDRIGKVCWSVFGVFAILKIAAALILPGYLKKLDAKVAQVRADEAAKEAARPKILRLAKSKMSVMVVGSADEVTEEHLPDDHSEIHIEQSWANEQEGIYGICTNIPDTTLSQGAFASYVTDMSNRIEHEKPDQSYGVVKVVRKTAGTFGKVPGYEIDYETVKDGEVVMRAVQFWVRDKDSLTDHIVTGEDSSPEGKTEFAQVIHSMRYDGQPYVEKKLLVGPKKPIF